MSDAPTPERKFRKATRQEQRQIEFLLREKLVQADDDGKLWAYRDGLDDEAIARMVAPDLSATSISRIRMEDYGTIRRPGADDGGALRSLAGGFMAWTAIFEDGRRFRANTLEQAKSYVEDFPEALHDTIATGWAGKAPDTVELAARAIMQSEAWSSFWGVDAARIFARAALATTAGAQRTTAFSNAVVCTCRECNRTGPHDWRFTPDTDGSKQACVICFRHRALARTDSEAGT